MPRPHRPELTYLDWLTATARAHPHDVAVIEDEGTVTYGELIDTATAVASTLRAEGLQRGTAIGLALEPSSAYLTLFLATMMAGGVAAPLNTRHTAAELRAYAASLDVSMIICDEGRPVPDGLRCRVLRVAGARPGQPLARQVAPLFPEAGSPVAELTLSPEEPAVIFPTGGTTGLSKGAFTDHRGLALWAWNVSATARRRRSDVELFMSPFFHVSMVVGLLVPLWAGNTVVLQRQFDPAAVLDAVARHRVNRLLGVPTMFKAILDLADAQGADLSGVADVLFGAAPASQTLIARLIRQFPNADVTTAMASTEWASSITRLEPEDLRAGRGRGIGRPLPGGEIRICDPDGRALPTGTVGEIAFRSPWQTLGYWNRPDETAKTYLPDGFVRIGDLGHVDEEGYLWLDGRAKDMVITGGENVYVGEVEQAIGQHPEVEEVVVFGVKDETWGERVEAAVRLAVGASCDGEALRAPLRDRLAAYKLPKRIHVVDQFPLTANNKPDRAALARQLGD